MKINNLRFLLVVFKIHYIMTFHHVLLLIVSQLLPHMPIVLSFDSFITSTTDANSFNYMFELMYANVFCSVLNLDKKNKIHRSKCKQLSINFILLNIFIYF